MEHTIETKNKIKSKVYSDEEKMARSENAKGIKNGMFGKNHSEESKKKISESKKGTIISDEHKKKISEKLLGKINKRSVSVSIYNKEGIKVITFATAFKRKLKEYN